MTDYYKTLGVNENISPPALKKTYRALAQKYHPDKNPGDQQAAEQFKRISEAYAVLGDPQKRAKYDADRSGSMFSFGGGLGAMFSDLFGNRPSGPPPPRDPRVNLNISLSEIKAGGVERVLELDNSVTCHNCAGRGGDQVAPCTTCNGQGRVQQSSRQGNSFFQRILNCSACQGRGKIILNPCTHCRGEGSVVKRETYHISVKCTLKN